MTARMNRVLTLLFGIALGCGAPSIETSAPEKISPEQEEVGLADPAQPLLNSTPRSTPTDSSTTRTVRIRPRPELQVTQEIASMSLDWVCRPKFHTAYGDAVTGTCFLVEVEYGLPPVVITANSLIGLSGGLHFDLNPASQGNKLSQLELLNCETNESLAIYPAKPLITIGRKDSNGNVEVGNLAAFQFPGAKAISAGRLANKPVKKDDRVWLLARNMGILSDTVKPHPAKVTWTGKNEPIVGDALTDSYNNIGYSFDNKHLSTRGLVGAPVVNDRGEVVAIHTYAVRTKTGLLRGTGNPTYRYREGLINALKTEHEGFEASYGEYTIQLPAGYSISSDGTADRVWATSDPQLGRCMIRLRILPNGGKYGTSLAERMKLLKTGFRSIAGGSSYSSSANGDPLSLPGLAAIKGDFAVSPGVLADPFGTHVAYSGLLLVGVNQDHILIAKFVTQGVSEGSSAWLLGERALNSLARPGKPLPSGKAKDSPDVSQVFIHVTGIRDFQYETILRGLVRIVNQDEYKLMSVNAVGEGLQMSLDTKLPAQAIADRIRLQVTPRVNAWTKMILVDLSKKQDVDSPATTGQESEATDPLMQRLQNLEAKSWLDDSEEAIQYVLEVDPSSASSDKIRHRVAIALSELLLSDPANTWHRHELIHVLSSWDREVARKTLRKLLVASPWYTRTEAFKALVEVADTSDIELAATELMQDVSGHTSEHAESILSKFPKEAELVVLEKLISGLCISSRHELRTIEALSRFGGQPTAKAFRELARKNKSPARQNALREGMAKLVGRLKNQ